MAQVFVINQKATLPFLRMEVIDNGRWSFDELWYMLQAATVTFSMWNVDTGVYKIANASANVVDRDDESCEEGFFLEYRWKERDTKESGVFIGKFTIKFETDVKVGDKIMPKGTLIAPISEELEIHINEGSIKKW